MNTRILLPVAVIAVLTSCSTAYKSGQTPDDVYFSPGKERAAYVSTNEDRDNRNDNYSDVSSRYLRMKSYNRSRWSSFDDDYLYWNDSRWNNPYMFNSWYGNSMSYGYGYGYGHMGYNSYYGYSNFYSNPWFWNNPFGSVYYGSPVIILNPKPVYRNPLANGPRTYNLNTYSVPGRKGYNPEYTGGRYNPSYSGSNAPIRVFGNTGNNGGSGAGRGGRYINTNSGSSSGRSYNNSGTRGNDNRSSSPVRTFDNNNSGSRSGGSSSGGSSSGSSGGSAPVRSFPRGGR